MEKVAVLIGRSLQMFNLDADCGAPENLLGRGSGEAM